MACNWLAHIKQMGSRSRGFTVTISRVGLVMVLDYISRALRLPKPHTTLQQLFTAQPSFDGCIRPNRKPHPRYFSCERGLGYLKWSLGYMGVEPRSEKMTTKVATLLCWLKHGPPPSDDMEVSHTCPTDQRRGPQGACCNPNHLVWERHQANMRRQRRISGSASLS